MKKLFAILMLLTISIVGFSQETGTVKDLINSFGWEQGINLVLGIVAFLFLGGFLFAQNKIRKAGELLIEFADAVEDKRIDANERKDLALKARELFSK